MNSSDSSSTQNNVPPPVQTVLAIPQAGISEILGLAELLKSKGGREDIYKLASELKMEFGETLNIIRGAEILGLVHTPGGDVVLEPLGEKVTKSRIKARKEIVKEQMRGLPLFQTISQLLNDEENHSVSRDQLVEKLAELAPNENAEHLFQSIVTWGRYAELFGYNDDLQLFYLDKGDPT